MLFFYYLFTTEVNMIENQQNGTWKPTENLARAYHYRCVCEWSHNQVIVGIKEVKRAWIKS